MAERRASAPVDDTDTGVDADPREGGDEDLDPPVPGDDDPVDAG